MLALAGNPEACLLECSDGVEVVDAGELRLGLDGLDFADLRIEQELVTDGEVFADRVSDVVGGLGLGRTFGPASRKARHRDTDTFVGLHDRDLVRPRGSATLLAEAWPARLANALAFTCGPAQRG